MIQKLQYYISPSHDPYHNLATEKYLLDTVTEDSVILYLWQNQNTVVIGKNQNAWVECRTQALTEYGGKLARRLSGGGAVFHDLGNLNFTFICAKENYDLARQMQVIQTACRLAGIETELSGRNDLLADGKKFSGNAFYNAQGNAYHHGTLLIDTDFENMSRFLTPSKAKLEAKGVKSVRARVVNLSTLSPYLTCKAMEAHMLTAFAKVYGFTPEQITEINESTIKPLAEEYGSWDYLYGKSLAFNVSAEGHFSWGHATLLLETDKGIIQDVQLYTDAMDETLATVVQNALKACPLNKTKIQDALSAVFTQALTEDFLNLIAQIL